MTLHKGYTCYLRGQWLSEVSYLLGDRCSLSGWVERGTLLRSERARLGGQVQSNYQARTVQQQNPGQSVHVQQSESGSMTYMLTTFSL